MTRATAILLFAAACGGQFHVTTSTATRSGAVELPPGWSADRDVYLDNGWRLGMALTVTWVAGQRIAFDYDGNCTNDTRAQMMLSDATPVPADRSMPGWEQLENLKGGPNERWACREVGGQALQVDADALVPGDWSAMQAVIDDVAGYADVHHALPSAVVSAPASYGWLSGIQPGWHVQPDEMDGYELAPLSDADDLLGADADVRVHFAQASRTCAQYLSPSNPDWTARPTVVGAAPAIDGWASEVLSFASDRPGTETRLYCADGADGAIVGTVTARKGAALPQVTALFASVGAAMHA